MAGAQTEGREGRPNWNTMEDYLAGIGIVRGEYDYVSLSYTDSKINQVIYKKGGSSGTVLATLTTNAGGYFYCPQTLNLYVPPSTSIKTINGLLKANVKSVNGLLIANVKSWNGLT